MRRWWKPAVGGAVALATLATVAVSWPGAGAAAAAQAERQVQVPIANRVLPVVITKVTLGDTVVQAGRFTRPRPTIDPTTPFQADGDWIRNLTIHLFNRTNTMIVFAKILLIFPETGDGVTRPYRVHPLDLGRMPAGDAFMSNGELFSQPPERVPLSFGPSQAMAVALGDHIDAIRSGTRSVIALAAATKLRIDLTEFCFVDGMRWLGGGFDDPDPQHPGKWKYRGSGYFPGDIDSNWPGLPGWVGQP